MGSVVFGEGAPRAHLRKVLLYWFRSSAIGRIGPKALIVHVQGF